MSDLLIECESKNFTMKRTVLLFLLAAVVSINNGYAQEEGPAEKKGFDKSKLFFGGNFGLSFGDYTMVNLSPQLGYRFNRFLAAGTSINLIYSSIKYRYNDPAFNYTSSYGVTGLSIFGRVYPIEQILLQVQPEMNYVWGKNKFSDGQPDQKLDGKFVPSLLLGGGAVIPAGRGSFVAMVQFDVLNNARSPYGNRPIYNFGYNVGF